MRVQVPLPPPIRRSDAIGRHTCFKNKVLWVRFPPSAFILTFSKNFVILFIENKKGRYI